MELTRRELIEDFKPYKVAKFIPYVWRQSDAVIGRLKSVTSRGKYTTHFGQELTEEIARRNCEESIIGKQDWTPYDIDEAKPYADATNFQVKRVINEVGVIYAEIYKDDYFKWQLKKAKLELISRN